LVVREKNLLNNGSFESGPWQDKVTDCDEYDGNGLIGMLIDTEEKSHGEQSLRLEAIRHIACVSTETPIAEAGDYLFTFDYQSPNAKQAQFLFLFNDREKTAIGNKIAVNGAGWHTYRGGITVPSGATAAELYFYANSSDGKADIINRYDNAYFGKLAQLATFGSPRENYFSIAKNTDGSWDIGVMAKPGSLRRKYAGMFASGLALAACLGYFVFVGWRAVRRRKSASNVRAQAKSNKVCAVFRLARSKIVRYSVIVFRDIRRRPWVVVVAALVAVGAGWWMGPWAGALCFVFVTFVIYGWDDRIVGAMSLGSLITCPFLIWLEYPDWAETMALYAYYFLTMTVVLRLVGFIRHSKKFRNR
jgi:hypothetical protein